MANASVSNSHAESFREIYLDHAAGTPPFFEVAELVAQLLHDFPGNPSGVHRRSRRAAAILDEARERVASCLGSEPRCVVFTSGGTEADNLAIKGIASWKLESEGLRGVVVSAIEHKAVLESARWLATRGFDVRLVPATEVGTVDLDTLESTLDTSVGLVSVMSANNETGVVQPLRQVSELVRAKAPRAVLHCDACQSLASQEVSLGSLGVDALSISGHKIGGPQGIGALVAGSGIEIHPLLHGGGQELGRRSGTQNVAAAAGLGLAVKLAASTRERFVAHTASLRARFEGELLEHFPKTFVVGGFAERLPNISCLAFAGVRAVDLLLMLDRRGVCASAGSACSSGSPRPSHVITAMRLSEEMARSTLRFSFGRSTTHDAVEAAVEAVADCLDRLTNAGVSTLAKK